MGDKKITHSDHLILALFSTLFIYLEMAQLYRETTSLATWSSIGLVPLEWAYANYSPRPDTGFVGRVGLRYSPNAKDKCRGEFG